MWIELSRLELVSIEVHMVNLCVKPTFWDISANYLQSNYKITYQLALPTRNEGAGATFSILEGVFKLFFPFPCLLCVEIEWQLELLVLLNLCRLRNKDINPHNAMQLKKARRQYFSSSSFMRFKSQNASNENDIPAINSQSDDIHSAALKLFLVPSKNRDDSQRQQYESYISVLWKIRDQVSLSLCVSARNTFTDSEY